MGRMEGLDEEEQRRGAGSETEGARGRAKKGKVIS